MFDIYNSLKISMKRPCTEQNRKICYLILFFMCSSWYKNKKAFFYLLNCLLFSFTSDKSFMSFIEGLLPLLAKSSNFLTAALNSVEEI
jgi:hypothetical protein